MYTVIFKYKSNEKMGLLEGVKAFKAKHLINSNKTAYILSLSALKYGAKWCILVLSGATFGKSSANNIL